MMKKSFYGLVVCLSMFAVVLCSGVASATDCNSDADCTDDNLFCTGVESCSSESSTCVSPGDPCAAGQTCNEDSNNCDEAPACTVNDNCTDNLFCTGDETCVEGACVAGPGNPCTAPTPACVEATDTCAECVIDANCAKGEVCEDNLCVLAACPEGTPPEVLLYDTDGNCLLSKEELKTYSDALKASQKLAKDELKATQTAEKNQYNLIKKEYAE